MAQSHQFLSLHLSAFLLCVASFLRQAFTSWRKNGCQSAWLLEGQTVPVVKERISNPLIWTWLPLANRPVSVTEDAVYFLTWCPPCTWGRLHPKEFGELLLKEEGMDAGWPGTPANAHYTPTVVEWTLMMFYFSWWEKLRMLGWKQSVFREWGFPWVWWLEYKGMPLSSNCVTVDHLETLWTLRPSVTLGRA